MCISYVCVYMCVRRVCTGAAGMLPLLAHPRADGSFPSSHGRVGGRTLALELAETAEREDKVEGNVFQLRYDNGMKSISASQHPRCFI